MQSRRIGLVLGFLAWCMQLVVFVQPFLPGHSAPGFGICQVIIDALSPSAGQGRPVSMHQAAQQHSAMGQPVHGQAVSSQTVSSQAVTSPSLHSQQGHRSEQQAFIASSKALPDAAGMPAHTVDHHFSHLSCGFCTLYGHAIPPPGPLPLWSASALTIDIFLPRFTDAATIVFSPDYITPQSRAPPVYYFS